MHARLEGGLLLCDAGRFRASAGRGGVRLDKVEGDGATPTGLLPLRRVFYRADRMPTPRASVPVEPLSPLDGWCDDPTDSRYNQRVALPYSGRYERLWRDDALYDVIGVLGWNDAPVIPGRGSAIFLHAAHEGHAPTLGCVALAPDDLLRVLAAGLSAIHTG